MDHIELGRVGEQLAREHLVSNGYLIKETNYKWGKGELDVICTRNDELIVVEVKTRNTSVYGQPYLSVGLKKQRQIIQIANHYVQERNVDMDVRFDVISIVHNTQRTCIDHIENAFVPLA